MANKQTINMSLIILLWLGTCVSGTAVADTLFIEQFNTDVFEICPNLVANPGFEDGLVYWDPFQYATGWTSSLDNPHTGSWCTRFNFPGGPGYYDASIRSSGYQIYVEAGTTYQLSFWIREKDTHDTYNSDMSIVDAGVNLNGIFYGAPSPSPSESWQFVSTTMTFPETGDAVVHFELHGYATSDMADFAVDDIALQKCDCEEWLRSDSSVWVDTTNGWLHLGQDDSYDDWAEKTVSFSLPVRVETRMRLVSEGWNYRLPWLFLDADIEPLERIEITYLSSEIHGWKLRDWTQIQTMAPDSEGVWRTVRAIIRSDGGELLAKSDSDTTFTSIVTKNWSISDSVVKISYYQPWDAVCDIDYVVVESWEPRSCSLFVGSSSTCLDPESMMIPLLVANDDTISAMTIPLHWETDCPGFSIDSVTFDSTTRIQDWESKTVIIKPDTLILGLIADFGGGTPPLPPGEGPIAYIYFSIDCDTANVYDSCFIAWDTTTVQPESQHLLFVDSHDNEFVPYFEPGTTSVALYRPGDVNCNCEINIGDIVVLINYVFLDGPEPCPFDAGDCNGDCNVDVGDVVCLINYLFLGGSPPVCGCASNPALAGNCGGCNAYHSLQKIAGTAQVGLVTSGISKEETKLVQIDAKFQVEAAGVQLEFSYDPKEVQSIVPELTDRTKDLSLFFSGKNGILKIGIVDLTGEHLIPAGEGPLVKLSITGAGMASLELQKAILVDEKATRFEVIIRPKEDPQAAQPRDFALLQNYPNPFNPETEISYSLPERSQVRLAIYNLRGQRVRMLVDEYQTAGHKTVHWNGTDDDGNKVASGIYFYRITAGDCTETKKMILIK